MKLIELVQASPALQKLIRQDLPLPTAYAVMKMVDKYNVDLSFYGMELVKADGDQEKISALQEMDVQTDLERIRIRMDENIVLSPTDVKYLQPIIDFYKEEKT